MGILVVGSIALDSVKTPFGEVEDMLGGSATYFSIAASHYTDVHVVAVVGQDFPAEHLKLFKDKGIDTSGIQRQEGRTFRWKGEYGFDLNTAMTLDTQLNVFADFAPTLQPGQRGMKFLFLANIDPKLQLSVLEQVQRPVLVACDTMNYWIESKRETLKTTLGRVDALLINDAETRQLADEPNLIKAGQRILSWGPKTIVIKRGEYGVLMINSESIFAAPAFPLESVVDPTGAGDSFAGGFMGHLAAAQQIDDSSLRKAIVFGSVMASFNVTSFGPKRLSALQPSQVEERFREFRELTYFEDI